MKTILKQKTNQEKHKISPKLPTQVSVGASGLKKILMHAGLSASLLSGVAISISNVGVADAAIAISDSGIAASSPPQSRPGSSGGGGANTSNTGIAMVGDGDCSIFAGDTTYAGVYGTDSTTNIGGMYGFGSQTVSRDYGDPSNAGANSGIVSYQSAEQTFGNITFHGFANSAQVANKTNAYGVNSLAIGCNTKALGVSSTAFGMNSQANGTASIAMGQSSIADANGTIAMGMSAQALSTDAIALGALSYASVRNTVAIGANAQATGISATALGSTANGSTDNGVLASGVGAVAIGGNTTKGAYASGSDAIAIAGQSSASATSSIALGKSAIASSDYSIAIGDSTKSTVAGGVALGATSVASIDAGAVGFNPFTNTNSTITGGTWVSTTGSVSVGDGTTITRQITGLAAGTSDTDAVNVAQLKQMRNYAAQGWNLSVGSGEASNVGIASTVNFSAGTTNNLVASAASSGNGVVYDLADDISLTSVTTGNSKLTTSGLAITVGSGENAGTTSLTGSGLTIANGPTVTTSGINANAKSVTNIADATLSDSSTDAVSGQQLYETNNNVTSLGTTVNTYATRVNSALGSGDITTGTAPSFSIQSVAKTNVADAFSAVDSAITTNKTNIATNAADISTLQANALQYSGGVFVATRDNVAQRITGVANGTAASDAVNKSQLDTVVSNSGWNLSADGENSVKINVGDTVDLQSGSNVVVSKTESGRDVTFALADDISLTSVTTGNSKLTTSGLAITVGSGESAGTTSLTGSGLTIANGPTVTTSGINAAAQKVTNLADATLSETSTDAVTGKQLNQTNTDLATTNTNLATTNSNVTALGTKVDTQATNVNTALGGGANIANGTAPKYTIQTAEQTGVADAFSAVDSAITTNKTNIATNAADISTLQTNALQYSGGVFVATRDNVAQKITGVAAGSATTDAVNYGQLSDAISASAWNLSVNGANATKIGNGATVDLKAGNSNLLLSKAETGTDVTFALADDISLTSVTTGNSKLTTSGLAITVGSGESAATTSLTGSGLTIANGPTVTTSGINAAAQKVTNLADATLSETSTDAVTGKQLNQTNTDLATTNTNLATTNSNVTALGTKVDTQATNVNTALGGGANIANGTAPKYTIQTAEQTGVADAFSAVDSAITTNKTNIATNAADISTLQTNALQYSGGVFVATRDNVAQKITGVAAGSATTDAVNYGQLSDAISASAWNLSVNGANATKIGNGATVDLKAGNSNLLLSKAETGTDVTFALADDISLTSVTTGNSKLTTSGLAITVGSGESAATTSLTGSGLTIANGPTVTTSGINAAAQKVTNLADATLSETSTDAVTGKQLNQTNTDLATTNTNLATTNSNVTALGTKVDTYATNINTAIGSGDITEGTAPSFNVQGKLYGSINAAFGGVDTSLSDINGQISNISSDALKWDTDLQAFNAARDNDSGEKTTSRITNVAAGEISATSTDVVNGSQLFSANQRINSVADITSSALGGGADLANGIAPSYQISTIVANNTRMLRAGSLISTYDNVGDALTKVDENVNIVNNKVDSVTNNVTNLNSNALLWDEETGAFNAGRSSDGEIVKSKITNIADGSLEANSSDAITGGQVYASNNQIASYLGAGAEFINGNWSAPNFVISQIDSNGNSTSYNYSNVGDALTGVNSSVNNVNKRVSEVQSQIDNLEPDDQALRYDESAGGYNAGYVNNQPNKIVNVADGTIAQGSKDAVNGGQLWDTNQRIDNIQNNVNDVANNAVTYDKDTSGNKTNSISLKGADASKPVVINNVADGKVEQGSKQAVNGGQLYDYTKEQMQVTLNDAKSYTDQQIGTISQASVEQANYYTDTKFNQLNGSINDVRKEARQAAAIGLAASSLRFDSTPGKLSVAAGGGFWKSEGAFAVGAGYTSETGKVRANITATSAGGDFGVGAGVSFTLN